MRIFYNTPLQKNQNYGGRDEVLNCETWRMESWESARSQSEMEQVSLLSACWWWWITILISIGKGSGGELQSTYNVVLKVCSRWFSFCTSQLSRLTASATVVYRGWTIGLISGMGFTSLGSQKLMGSVQTQRWPYSPPLVPNMRHLALSWLLLLSDWP